MGSPLRVYSGLLGLWDLETIINPHLPILSYLVCSQYGNHSYVIYTYYRCNTRARVCG